MYLDANPFISTLNDTKGFKPVTFFRYSKDTVRMEEWINKIPTPNLKLSGKTRVCIKHFDDKDIKEVIYSNVGDPDIIVSL